MKRDLDPALQSRLSEIIRFKNPDLHNYAAKQNLTCAGTGRKIYRLMAFAIGFLDCVEYHTEFLKFDLTIRLGL